MASQTTDGMRLDSWKDIASYLKRDVRTVIRWEQSRGLPVRRLPGETRSAVYAFTSEIDAWLSGQGKSTHPSHDGPSDTPATSSHTPSSLHTRSWWMFATAAAAFLLAALLVYRDWLSHQEPPATASFTTDSIQAWDSHHNLLWEYRFPEPFANTAKVGEIVPIQGGEYDYSMVNRATVHDLFGDGKSEVLAVTLFPREGLDENQPRQVLSCFGPTGKLLWSYEPQDVVTFGPRTYRAPWQLIDLIVSDEPGPKTIWVSVEAYVWGKSLIARLDAKGHASIQYVHSGTIAVFQRLHGPLGSLLWIGGFNDEYDTADLAVMRDNQPYAISPQTPGGRYDCAACPHADTLAYFVLPRYDLSRAIHNPDNRVYELTSDTAIVQAHQMEISKRWQVLYDFTNDTAPHPVRVNYASDFWSNHLDLEREGKLDHPLAKCPDRLHPPPVRAYEHGIWREIPVPSQYSQ